MKIDRRVFLLGAAATIASTQSDKLEVFAGKTSTGFLDPRLHARLIRDVTLSSMPDGIDFRSAEWLEDPIAYSLLRNGETVYADMMNPRCSVRWVAIPGNEIAVLNEDTFGLDLSPCFSNVSLTIISNIELDPAKRPRCFSECFRWRDGKITLSSISALRREDQHVLERAP